MLIRVISASPITGLFRGMLSAAGTGIGNILVLKRRVGHAYALVMILTFCAAQAEQASRDATKGSLSFNIPAQPLSDALQAYGQITGVEVLYESKSAAGHQSVAVEGNFTPAAALQTLLGHSGLRVTYSGADAVTLAAPSATDDGPPLHPLASATDLYIGTVQVHGSADDVDPTRLQDFSTAVQLDIQSALQRNVGTRAGNYRLVLDLWVDPSRTIKRIELSQSTGNAQRDATVEAVLQGLVLSRPAPSNAPQPVRVVIAARASK
jgi:hypothetical protein